jgi:hypothetical protein
MGNFKKTDLVLNLLSQVVKATVYICRYECTVQFTKLNNKKYFDP